MKGRSNDYTNCCQPSRYIITERTQSSCVLCLSLEPYLFIIIWQFHIIWMLPWIDQKASQWRDHRFDLSDSSTSWGLFRLMNSPRNSVYRYECPYSVVYTSPNNDPETFQYNLQAYDGEGITTGGSDSSININSKDDGATTVAWSFSGQYRFAKTACQRFLPCSDSPWSHHDARMMSTVKPRARVDLRHVIAAKRPVDPARSRVSLNELRCAIHTNTDRYT